MNLRLTSTIGSRELDLVSKYNLELQVNSFLKTSLELQVSSFLKTSLELVSTCSKEINMQSIIDLE